MARYLSLLYKIFQNKLGSLKIFKLDVQVTSRCNLRCRYCRIWENPVDGELTPSDYARVFEELDLSWLHLTGGEPFLRDDLVRVVSSAKSKMTNLMLTDISTNGFITEKIVETVRSILDENTGVHLEVGVSVDGLPETHDKLRGVPGAWSKATETYVKLRDLSGEHTNFHVHVNHVLYPENVGSLPEFVDSMGKLGITPEDVSLEVGRISPFFANENVEISLDEKKVLDAVDYFLSQLNKKTFNPRILLRSIYLKYAKDYIKYGRQIPCTAGTSSLYLDPHGVVHPCSGLHDSLGTIKEKNIWGIINSSETKKTRNRYRNCKQCWSGCEGITSIIQHMPWPLAKT